jgi:hypothetical protein
MEESILEAQREFNKLVDFVTRDALNLELHKVEAELFRMLLGLGRMLLELFLRSVGTGSVGQTAALENGSVLRYRRTSPKKYLSVFGEVTIMQAYYHKEGCKGVSLVMSL